MFCRAGAGVRVESLIRTCLHYLGEITTKDKLDYIFSKFYIGK